MKTKITSTKRMKRIFPINKDNKSSIDFVFLVITILKFHEVRVLSSKKVGFDNLQILICGTYRGLSKILSILHRPDCLHLCFTNVLNKILKFWHLMKLFARCVSVVFDKMVRHLKFSYTLLPYRAGFSYSLVTLPSESHHHSKLWQKIKKKQKHEAILSFIYKSATKFFSHLLYFL